MTQYPIEVLRIAAGVERLGVRIVNAWDTIYLQRNYLAPSSPKDEAPIKFEMRTRAADMIAHKFAGHVLRHSLAQFDEEPEGLAIKMDCYALSRVELLQLLYQAFAEGQADGMKRNIKLGPIEG